MHNSELVDEQKKYSIQDYFIQQILFTAAFHNSLIIYNFFSSNC